MWVCEREERVREKVLVVSVLDYAWLYNHLCRYVHVGGVEWVFFAACLYVFQYVWGWSICVCVCYCWQQCSALIAGWLLGVDRYLSYHDPIANEHDRTGCVCFVSLYVCGCEWENPAGSGCWVNIWVWDRLASQRSSEKRFIHTNTNPLMENSIQNMTKLGSGINCGKAQRISCVIGIFSHCFNWSITFCGTMYFLSVQSLNVTELQLPKEHQTELQK